jgi:hypothetical protein
MTTTSALPRRTFLKGLGTVMTLPVLESLLPRAAAAAAVAQAAPRRMAFIYVPNGANMADWTPKAVGTDFELPMILEPLKDLRSDLNVLSGLGQKSGFAGPDGAGDHARASATYLTSTRIRKTNGADIKAGISVDQAAAIKAGQFTRLPSLELGCDRGQLSGNCDSGYSCAYSFNISWKGEATPMPPEVDPRLAFERLFASGDPNESAESRARRERYQKSILDFVLEDANQLKRQLGRTDQRKVEEYLSSVRELERRIEMAEKAQKELPGFTKPTGIPRLADNKEKVDFQAHSRLMFDLMTLAFQTDTTRIATFVLKHDGSNDPYPQIGVSEGHHDLSHHQKDEEKKAKIAKINRYHMEQFAYFLNRLKSIKEGEGTLLDSCMITYGSGLADGNQHAHNDLPLIMAGRGGGTITTGRHVRFPKDTPLANLFLSMMERMGVNAERFGDSTGRLSQLTA